MGKKKFDFDAVERRWLRRVKADRSVMAKLTEMVSLVRRLDDLQSQVNQLSDSIDESEVVSAESVGWTGRSLRTRDYEVNGQNWWQYGDGEQKQGPLQMARSLARYLAIKERDGVGA